MQSRNRAALRPPRRPFGPRPALPLAARARARVHPHEPPTATVPRALQRAQRAETDSGSLLAQLESLLQAKQAIASDRAELGRGISLLRAERELLCEQLQGARRAGGRGCGSGVRGWHRGEARRDAAPPAAARGGRRRPVARGAVARGSHLHPSAQLLWRAYAGPAPSQRSDQALCLCPLLHSSGQPTAPRAPPPAVDPATNLCRAVEAALAEARRAGVLEAQLRALARQRRQLRLELDAARGAGARHRAAWQVGRERRGLGTGRRLRACGLQALQFARACITTSPSLLSGAGLGPKRIQPRTQPLLTHPCMRPRWLSQAREAVLIRALADAGAPIPDLPPAPGSQASSSASGARAVKRSSRRARRRAAGDGGEGSGSESSGSDSEHTFDGDSSSPGSSSLAYRPQASDSRTLEVGLALSRAGALAAWQGGIAAQEARVRSTRASGALRRHAVLLEW